MIDERILLGFPIDFKDICQIYPPTVNDVVGNKDFGVYQSLFTMTQEELDKAFLQDEKANYVPTPFQYLLMNYYQDEIVREKIHKAFTFFIHEPVTIVPEIKMLLIGKSENELDPNVDLEEPRLLTEENYFEFQNKIRQVMGLESLKPSLENENLDPRVKRWKMKVQKYHEVIAKKKSKTAPTLGTLLTAICCMGIGLNPLNIGEISYACVQWLISMEQQKEEYDIDIRALLAGADSKKVKPKYWIKNIDEKEK